MLLPTYAGTLEDYQLTGSPLVPQKPERPFNRTVFAAAHVIADPLKPGDPWSVPPAVDWESTLRFRHFLWDQGLGLAEAMDTAQRGMGVDWETARELINRTMREAKSHPLNPRVACGAGTDQFAVETLTTEEAVLAAYTEQMEAIEAAGGQIILMASRAVAALETDPETYARIYSRLIEQAAEPVILHWLGDMFDPALTGYWGQNDYKQAAESVLSIIQSHESRIDGIKISLLDKAFEESFRTRLPDSVRLYTGDDYNYPELIQGSGDHYSHALLGIFAAISPAASQALEALSQGDLQRYNTLLQPTVPLAREIFKSPTQYYKAGIAFLAWLNGQQEHFIMPGGFQSSRDICHYAEVYRLADQANLLLDPVLAEKRMQVLLNTCGIW